MADKLVRFGVSMERGLLERFDRFVKRRGYANRSEALRNLAGEALIEHSWEDERRSLYGTVTLVYDHHVRGLNEKLLAIQHDHADAIVTTVHVHAARHVCMEVLVVRGRPGRIRALRDALASTRGVAFARVSLAGSGKEHA